MKPRIAESADEIYNWVKANISSQIRFNTLGEGCFFLDKDLKLNKIVDKYLMREATNGEFDDLLKWLDRDMIQVEEKRGFKWIVIHSPSGLSFK